MNQAISLVELQRALNGALTASPVTTFPTSLPALPEQALVDKFQTLLQKAQPTAPLYEQSQTGSAASKLVKEADETLKQVGNDALYMMNHANEMSVPQLTFAAIQMQFETASAQIDMQMSMGFVTATKGAIDSLMRNQ